MHADGKSTLASVSKWNSRKVNWMQVLKWSSWHFLSPLILQKMKENNISQLDDYHTPFCEQQTGMSLVISLFKLTFPEFHFETEAKVDFPSACIWQRRPNFEKMFSILNRALSWAITSFGNKFCLKKRSRLIEALDNRFYVKFMELEIGLFKSFDQFTLPKLPQILDIYSVVALNVCK